MNSLHDKDNTYKRLAKEAYDIKTDQKEITCLLYTSDAADE